MKVGCETVAHMFQVLTDPDATVVSVDGVGAFDLISRVSMMKGLRHVVVRIIRREVISRAAIDLFCGRRMPAKLHQSHRAKVVIKDASPFFSWVNTQRSLPQAWCKMARLFAYLDDSYIICRPARVGAVHELLRHWLWVHSGV